MQNSLQPQSDEKNNERDNTKEVLDSSTVQNRNLFIAFLLFNTYLLVAVLGATDRQLLLPDSRVELPFINVSLDLLTFYIFSPFLLIAFYLNMLFNLKLHRDKLKDWLTRYSENPNPNHRLKPFLFNYALILPPKPSRAYLNASWLIWCVTLLYPVITLMVLGWRFADYHDYAISLTHLIAIYMMCLITLHYTSELTTINLEENLKKYQKSILKRILFTIQKLNIIFFKWFAIIFLMFFSVFYFISFYRYAFDDWDKIVRSENPEPYRKFCDEIEQKIIFQIPSNITPWIDTPWIGAPKIEVTEALLVSRSEDQHYLQRLLIDPSADHLDQLQFVERLNLKGRNLRCADLSGSFLPRADLTKAQMEGADLSHAHLQKANLFMASLQGATLSRASLQGADLREASLQGADLREASLQGADLREASLQGADLREASLQGADLWEASLQGADLREASLQGADLREASLQGADLWEASLQGADLREASLQGADLWEASLQGADLREASLQGADLNSASLQGANLWKVDFRGAGLADANLHGAFCSENFIRNKGRKLNGREGKSTELEGCLRLGKIEPKERERILEQLESFRYSASLFIVAETNKYAEQKKREVLERFQRYSEISSDLSQARKGIFDEDQVKVILKYWDEDVPEECEITWNLTGRIDPVACGIE